MEYGYYPTLLKECGTALLSWIYNTSIDHLGSVLLLLCWFTSYIYLLLHWRPSILSIPHQHTSVCFLFIVFYFSLSACPTDIVYPWKGFVSLRVCSLYPPCAKLGQHFWVGGVIHPVTLTNAYYIAPQFSSPYFFYGSWYIFHHTSDNSP